MTVAIRPETRAEALPTQGASLLPKRASESRSELPATELAFRIVAAFRAHPHINNVLTHIARANWVQVERSLNRILDPATASDGLSPLEENIIELMCAERGITGRTLKPHFHAVLYRLVAPGHAERLIRHVEVLFLGLEWKAQHAAPPPAPSEPAEESPMPETDSGERVINVADIDPRHRHAILFRLFEHLAPDQSLQIVVGHDPRRLHLQLEATHGPRCAWSYLEKGPDIWRVRLRLLPAESGDLA